MSNVPMTRPEEALAIHHERGGHSCAFVTLGDGAILRLGAGGFSSSSDGGMTWSEPVPRTDADGNSIDAGSASLVRLDGDGVGLATGRYSASENARTIAEMLFRRSPDGGVTWSSPISITPLGVVAHALQDVALRTASGRIILPTYAMYGQGSSHAAGAPHTGALVAGQWVSTDAHFVDPHFGACEVYYSDDDGLTWQPNRDGVLFVQPEWAGPFHATFEPTIAEVSPGRLLMLMRTNVGRLYQAWSDDNGETWSYPQSTVLAASPAPAQVRHIPATGHLVVVWTQQSEDETRQGFVRTRLSSAISRNGGGVWEFYQNVVSIHEAVRVEPGPIQVIRPEGMFTAAGEPALERDPAHIVDLPEGWGRWSYPSVLVHDDRILISHTYTRYERHPERAELVRTGGDDGSNSRLKVLPLTWFYGGREPADNPDLNDIEHAAHP